MRKLTTTLLICFALTVIAVPVLAETPLDGQRNPLTLEQSHEDWLTQLHRSGPTALEVSPMLLEILALVEEAVEAEEALLAKLALTAEDDEVQAIVHRIVQLEMDTRISILQVQIRYARLEHDYALEKQLKNRVVELIDQEMAMLQ